MPYPPPLHKPLIGLRPAAVAAVERLSAAWSATLVKRGFATIAAHRALEKLKELRADRGTIPLVIDCRRGPRPRLPRPHLRLPDERPRLREGREPAAPRRLAPSARTPEAADLLLINTCSIREKAEHRLYSDLGVLRALEGARAPGRVLGVGGCVAQQEGDALLRRFAAARLRLRHPQPAPGARAGRGGASAASAPRASRRRARRERFDLPERHPAFAGRDAGPRLRHGDGGLRPVLQLLHRAAHARPRDQPPGGGASSPRPRRSPRAACARSRCSARP